MIESMKNRQTLIKILDISLAVVFFVSLALSHFELPPASYLISLYCRLLDTSSYPVVFIAAMMTLMVSLPVYLLKIRLQNQQNL